MQQISTKIRVNLDQIETKKLVQNFDHKMDQISTKKSTKFQSKIGLKFRPKIRQKIRQNFDQKLYQNMTKNSTQFRPNFRPMTKISTIYQYFKVWPIFRLIPILSFLKFLGTGNLSEFPQLYNLANDPLELVNIFYSQNVSHLLSGRLLELYENSGNLQNATDEFFQSFLESEREKGYVRSKYPKKFWPMTPFFIGPTHSFYHKFGNMVFFRAGNLYSLCSAENEHYQQIIYFLIFHQKRSKWAIKFR